jgi:hypothetical protein
MSRLPAEVLLLALLCALLLPPSRAGATEMSSLYLQVHISPTQYEKWLDSPVRRMEEYTDWSQMTDQWEDGWKEHYYHADFRTVRELVESIRKEAASKGDGWTSPPFYEYDAENGTLTYAQLLFDENFINYMLSLAALRSLADFKDTDGPDFVVIYPYLWDPGCDVILEISRNKTAFYRDNNTPPEFAAFKATADAHFAKELENNTPRE